MSVSLGLISMLFCLPIISIHRWAMFTWLNINWRSCKPTVQFVSVSRTLVLAERLERKRLWSKRLQWGCVCGAIFANVITHLTSLPCSSRRQFSPYHIIYHRGASTCASYAADKELTKPILHAFRQQAWKGFLARSISLNNRHFLWVYQAVIFVFYGLGANPKTHLFVAIYVQTEL